MVPDELWRKIDRVDDWLERSEADLLYDLAESPWCELGSWKGRSTMVLAAKGPGVAIDWFKGSPEMPPETDTEAEFRATLKDFEVEPLVQVISARLEDVADQVGPVRFLYLDADHGYEATRLAFELYAGKVLPGGLVGFHDARGLDGTFEGTHWPGVTQAFLEARTLPEWVEGPFAQRLATLIRR